MLAELRRMCLKLITPEQRARFRRYQSHHLRGPQHLLYGSVFGSNLKGLALCYGTDKWTVHSYVDIYDRLFRPLRKKKLNVLEIGVGGYDDPLGGGGSLRMWRTYFPKSNIFAIDIEDKSPHHEKRIKTFRGSQDDEKFLTDVADHIGRIDIIIDDGSHMCPHVIKSFEVLLPRLAPGGIYVVEDTQTSYWNDYGGSTEELDCPTTTMNFFGRLIDGVNSREIERAKKQLGEDYVPPPLQGMLFSICFYEKMIVMRKKPS
jgi:hypothetical protein